MIGIETINPAPAGNALTRFDRAIDAAPVAVTDQVFSQLRFTYLTADGLVTVDPLAIARVQVNLTGRSRAQVDGAGRHNTRAEFTTYAYQSEVRVRAR
jgi:hypothetical protein